MSKPEGLQVHRLTTLDQCAALASAWDSLTDGVPFRTFAWAECWYRHYRHARTDLCVLAVADERGDLVGLAPWYVQRSRSGERVMHFLGSGEVCSDYLTILARSAARESVAKALAEWLTTEGLEAWHAIELDGVTEDDETVGLFGKFLAEAGYQVNRHYEESCWVTELPGDLATYLATLSRTRRERTRSMFRKVIDGGLARIRRVESESELETGFANLVELHQKRRNSLGQPGCFASPQFTAFHREISEHFRATGQLRLTWLESEGRPLAAEYSIVGGQTVYYYQGGFEPDVAEMRPGWMSIAKALERSIDEGVTSFDFLRGDEPYKASWGAKPRQLAHVRIIGRQPSARVRDVTRRGAEAVKGWARRVLSRSRG